jgi:methionine-rich copper-binding protein CopC
VLVTVLAAPTAVRAAQSVVSIAPDNGGYVEQAPTEVVLTFADPVEGDVTATLRTPDGELSPDPVVEGDQVSVPVDDAGPGDYEVAVVVDGRTSSTGFTVLAAGEQAPVEQASYGPLLIGALLVAFVLVGVLTFRKLFRR